jgi:hypothetical protein
MALSADQEAMLQLMLQRGQSYGDLAGLLGLSEEDVRSRARTALSELGGADPDRHVGLTDWLLGQADPIGRADAVRHLKENPDDHALATRLRSELAEIAPGAELPKLPAEPRAGKFLRRSAPVAAAEPAPAAGPSPTPAAAGGGRGVSLPSPTSLSQRQIRTIAILGFAAVIVLAVVLAVSGAFGGDSSGNETSATATNPAATGGGQEIERVPLQPTAGGDAEGDAVFGIVNRNQAYLDLKIRNLDPAPEGKAYVVWLLFTPEAGHPLSPIQVTPDGTYDNRIPIESFLTRLAANTQFVDVSLAPAKQLGQRIRQAAQKGNPVIQYTGESVLRGRVPGTGGG